MALWPLGLYVLAVALLVGAMLGVPQLLGERHRQRVTGEPFEAGIPATGTARVRIASHYYVVAMLFVLFDLEAVFFFAWAVVARELGWAAYVEVLVFTGVLLAALAYLWRAGALDWGTSARARAERIAAKRRPAREVST